MTARPQRRVWRALGAAALGIGTLTVVGAALLVPQAAGATTSNQIIYAGNQRVSVTSYSLPATGNLAPTLTVTIGPSTSVLALAFDAHGDLWCANTSTTITMYSPTQLATGGSVSTPPAITITAIFADGLAFTGTGSLWVAHWATGSTTSTLTEYSPTQLKASGNPTPAVTIASNTSTSLNGPENITFDATGDLWVANSKSDTVVEYTATQLATSGNPTPAVTISTHKPTPTTSTTWSLDYPVGVAFDASGNLWVSNDTNKLVSEFTPAQQKASGSPAPATTLSVPGTYGWADAFDASGNLWVATPTTTALVGFSPAQQAAGGAVTPAYEISGATTGLHTPEGIVVKPPPSGYDLVGSDGGVFVFNPTTVTGGFYGSLPGTNIVPNTPVVGMVPTVSNRGYFLVAADGGVFSFGNAPFLGSLPQLRKTPAAPIVGIIAAKADSGYYLVGRDGGVFAFGAVPFLGSLPGTHVTVDNVIGIAATPSGTGYWVVQATGSVHAFGAATAFPTAPTTSAVTAIAGTPTGNGYWLVTKEGGVYPYGTATKKGTGTLPAIRVVPALPVIGIVPTAGTAGYWLLGQDGGIFAFGTAPYYGSLPGLTVHVTDIVGAVPN